MIPTIGIIGYGFVGKAQEYLFRTKNASILCYDKFLESSSLEEVVDNSEYIFVCVPTPYKDDAIDLTIMDEVMGQIAPLASDTDKIIIIKSTVIPGTTATYAKQYSDCHFAMSPEFLREKHYQDDVMKPDRMVVGSDESGIASKVANLYKSVLPDAPIFESSATAAEMVKYMSNCFLATKIIFANEMFDLCEALDVDYDAVKDMVAADKRIGGYLDVTALRGFGDKCLPKDMIALRALFKKMGVDDELLTTVWEKNLRIRKVRNWEDIPFVKS
ncbi:MAG: hypothetical protein Q8Q33_06315 [Chlamydiota bacterium]|nr:hypothetical protein [Chlamydiota bacterium]